MLTVGSILGASGVSFILGSEMASNDVFDEWVADGRDDTSIEEVTVIR